MAVVRRDPSDSRTGIDPRALNRVAVEQYGVVSRQQLRNCGGSDTLIARWLEAGRVHRVHRGVFALGHTALSLEARLHAALLYAGPDAVLSHTTAAWVWLLIGADPRRIHVTIPRRRRSLSDVRVHYSRRVPRLDCRGFPVTPVARTLTDLAAMLTGRDLRRAVAEADFRGLLDRAEVEAVLSQRRPGSSSLRAALADHLPQLAETLSVLEERFLVLCQSAGLPLPEVNAKVGRMRVDAVWRHQRVAIELDGAAAHRNWAATKRDRQRELALRAMRFQVVRYTWDQVTERPDQVIADLRRLLCC